ncbi:MAG: inorganic phosphate transporter [Bacteroidales bacterium]|nr:inorganic phosphate transporter [Bacteroidales bacterium]MCF8343281.1 inorganic phosphate transporter [Bacteroidales bacterium]MCF8350853.1 inorganic phosphate transporter [Bacteroidales bacterium]MCF8375750.1 inorganic phosphate transporter [Bacteroidales bacterium]MCF8400350.1 inorganic phosphate transporter [Bacteroidales bacterium]
METIYLVLVGFLFILAISDLMVGVSNDAVNFLNSAIGSKVAPLRVIMIIAALGIVFGATFSSGMMEVARKGIFHPQYFYFSEIIVIFLAVMITDVLLLDLFNTFGMPTSTTVSIVFELLGAAVAIAMLKAISNPGGMGMGEYINSGKALAIISGILLSVVIAFTIGAIVQYFARLLFSFNYKRNLKYFGAIWGGIAITAITYFILIKGAKGASFMSGSTVAFIKQNTLLIIVGSFIFWTIILQLFTWLTKMNILKFIVLVGTFALAMAFAGNDLVNFIGVPLAGYESFVAFRDAQATDPDMFLMTSLTGAVKTPTFFLLIAGIIMVITLWTSKKSRSVTKTEINLARQNVGYERFGSSLFARSAVRWTTNASQAFRRIMPNKINKTIERQFDQREYKQEMKTLGQDAPYFDLIRASVNLVVASVLIAFATSLKLPLSTTYVTFMVAMGTSLSDKAWGRESAVYRITGVLSVIGGWFFTALSAFTCAFIIALLFAWGGFIIIIVMMIIALIVIIKTHAVHKRRSSEAKKHEEIEVINEENIVQKSADNIINTLNEVVEAYDETMEGLGKEDLKILKSVYKKTTEINKTSKRLKDNIHHTVDELQEDSVETGHYYVQVLDYLREIGHALNFITSPSLDHVKNNHKGMIPPQIEELGQIKNGLAEYIKECNVIISNNDFSKMNEVTNIQQNLLKLIDQNRKNQIKRIKRAETGTKNSMLFLNNLQETKNLVLFILNLLKSYRDFVIYDNKINGK